MTDSLALVQRLPKLVADAETAVAAIARGGVRLHPETVAALADARARRGASPLMWAAIAGLILAFVAFT